MQNIKTEIRPIFKRNFVHRFGNLEEKAKITEIESFQTIPAAFILTFLAPE